MLTGVRVMPKLSALGRVGFRPTPYDWVPLAVIILLIVVIFVRVYGGGGRSAGQTAHRSGRRTRLRAGRAPEPGNHGHQPASKRRPTGRDQQHHG